MMITLFDLKIINSKVKFGNQDNLFYNSCFFNLLNNSLTNDDFSLHCSRKLKENSS